MKVNIFFEIAILVFVMVLVGLLIGWAAGLVWKKNRPIGVRGDYIAAVLSAVILGLVDWFLIPAMGFSDNLRNLGTATEPALGALLVLWIIRQAKK
ncbi:MAG: hypothetical protein JXA13_09315 [Anaerolineales bacterium]|nr:hypothetical protein [Anaerolineales bacterium]